MEGPLTMSEKERVRMAVMVQGDPRLEFVRVSFLDPHAGFLLPPTLSWWPLGCPVLGVHHSHDIPVQCH